MRGLAAPCTCVYVCTCVCVRKARQLGAPSSPLSSLLPHNAYLRADRDCELAHPGAQLVHPCGAAEVVVITAPPR